MFSYTSNICFYILQNILERKIYFLMCSVFLYAKFLRVVFDVSLMELIFEKLLVQVATSLY